ncbi:MAG: hypothetical protein ACPL5I_07790, partial [Thermodesulfobacteriota bacterium]
SDFPQRDDEKWRKHVILFRGVEAEDIQLNIQPVQSLTA